MELTLAGYHFLASQSRNQPIKQFLKLGVDSWPCDESIVAELFQPLDEDHACHAGNYWYHNLPGSLATDIFLADIRFGNVFEEFNKCGQQENFEISMSRAVSSVGHPYLIPERDPVHNSNRWAFDALKWTISHHFRDNINHAKALLLL